MVLTPITTTTTDSYWSNICLVATDVDGTLTQGYQFTPELIQAMNQLTQVGIDVILITGRSAGWVQALNTYLPVKGAIAENGGIFYQKNESQPQFLTSILDYNQHRQNLAEMFQTLWDWDL